MCRYSMECLLSYIEIVQYQQYISKYIEDKAILEKYDLQKFPSVVPQSEIIEQQEVILNDYNADEALLCAKMKAHKLYEKYIKIGSEFEINISSKERKKISKIVSDLDSFLQSDEWKFKELLQIFEVSKKEMRILLNYSLKRFQLEDNQYEISAVTEDPGLHINLSVSLYPSANDIVPTSTPSPGTQELTPLPSTPSPGSDFD